MAPGPGPRPRTGGSELQLLEPGSARVYGICRRAAVDVEDAVGLTWAACERIDAEGLVPVLAHPERCPAVAADAASAVRFAARGWPLCLNGPSVLGDHGRTAERIAWRLLGEGAVSLVASDAHGAGRLPVLDVAREAIAQRLGADIAEPLFDGRALQLGYD